MSDFHGGRPSKRPKRDSHSPVSSEGVGERRPSRDRRNPRRSPDTNERRKWRGSRDRGRDRGTEGYGRERSLSRDDAYPLESGRGRAHRDRSHDRDTDRSARSHRHRRRSDSPRSDRFEYENKERGRDRDARRDRKSHRAIDQDRDRHRSREKHGDGDRGRHLDKERNQDYRRHSASPKPYQRQKGPLPSQKDAFNTESNPNMALDKPIEKQKPNFGLTGKLAAASNTVQTANQSIVLKYHEPPEARKPSARDRWRLYIFKDDEILDTVELAEQSCWLFGREAAVVDIPIEHSSCSKQHAVVQFRYIEKRNEFGDKIGKVKPYVIDLESANGTTVNEDPVPAAKYVELIDKDVLRFGHSTREYVVQLPPSGK